MYTCLFFNDNMELLYNLVLYLLHYKSRKKLTLVTMKIAKITLLIALKIYLSLLNNS